MWLGYVGDTFILWLRQEEVQVLLDQIDSIRPTIHFIMEKQRKPIGLPECTYNSYGTRFQDISIS